MLMTSDIHMIIIYIYIHSYGKWSIYRGFLMMSLLKMVIIQRVCIYIYICMYVCMCVFIYTYLYIYIYLFKLYKYIIIYIHTCIYIYCINIIGFNTHFLRFVDTGVSVPLDTATKNHL